MRTKKPLEVEDVSRGQLNGWVLTQKCTSLNVWEKVLKGLRSLLSTTPPPPPFLPEERGLSAERICDWEY